MEKHPEKPDELAKQHQRLLLEDESYLSAIRKHNDRIGCLDTKVEEMKTRLWQRKKEMGGRICIQQRPHHQIKQICIMENRVNQATAIYDKLLSRIRLVRDEIDHLWRQRCTFTQMYQHLNEELLSQLNAKDHLEEKSLLANDQRFEVLERMLAVRERSERETGLCLTEMAEHNRIIDHYVKLHSFMVKKSEERVPMGKNEHTKKRKAEQAKRERIEGESLETYRAVHQLIVDVYGDSDLCEIGNTFMQDEDQNFAYFTYINELNNNSTVLTSRINKIKSEIVHLELEKKLYDEQQVQLKQRDKGELERHRSLVANLESRHTVVQKCLDRHKTLIGHLFDKMQCSIAPITGKLGCSAVVTNDNVTQFIGILEERINRLLMVQAQRSYKESEEMEVPPQNLLLVCCSLLPTVAPAAIKAPSIDDSSIETPLGQQTGSKQPLYFQSLRDLVLPRVMQTEQDKGPRAPSTPQRGRKKINPKPA
ncbi:hypothetical protein DPEC_G00198400 [Dallia pectoralis]|uniref:Uncharacterized protein n=1 Tax=Dallia pectoralis TaxID=75939 RepID=A0ACC2G862_DALPE|nr:hypothetical protein DPEC_G00198400 [Dallia pectoralis]